MNNLRNVSTRAIPLSVMATTRRMKSTPYYGLRRHIKEPIHIIYLNINDLLALKLYDT